MRKLLSWTALIVGLLLVIVSIIYIIFANQINTAACFKCGETFNKSLFDNLKEIMSTLATVPFLGLVLSGYGIYGIKKTNNGKEKN